MKKRHYPVIIEQDTDGVFIVTCPSFKGCHSYGSSIDEAVANISEAIEACIDDDMFREPIRFIGVRDVEVSL